MTDAVHLTQPSGVPERLRVYFRPDTLAVAAWAVFVYYAVTLGRHLWTSTPPDLSALYMAGYFFGSGGWGMIYDYPAGFFQNFAQSWDAAARQLGFDAKDTWPYVYPPLWAALLAPIVKLIDPFTFFRVFIVVELAMFAGTILCAYRICKSFAPPNWIWVGLSTALCAYTIVAMTAIWHLQPQVIVTFLTLWAFEKYLHGKHISAGVILAVAASMKIVPAGFAILFLLDRNWRAFAACALTGAALLALSLALGGLQLHLDFLESASAASQGIFFTRITYTVEMSLYAVGMWAGAFPYLDTTEAVERILHTPASVAWMTKGLGIAALVWSLWATRNLADPERLAARLMLLTIVFSCFGPLGWTHYFLPVMFLLPGLFGLLSLRMAGLLVALFFLVTMKPSQLMMREILVEETVVGVIHTGLMAILFLGVSIALCRRQERPT